MKRYLFALLIAVSALGSDSPSGYEDAATEMKGLEGTWREAAVEADGQRFPAAAPFFQTFRAGKWKIYRGDASVEGFYRIETSGKPAYLDETPTVGGDKGRMRKYIYQVNGNTLRTAFTQEENVRPRSFDEKGIVIITWKRVK